MIKKCVSLFCIEINTTSNNGNKYTFINLKSANRCHGIGFIIRDTFDEIFYKSLHQRLAVIAIKLDNKHTFQLYNVYKTKKSIDSII